MNAQDRKKFKNAYQVCEDRLSEDIFNCGFIFLVYAVRVTGVPPPIIGIDQITASVCCVSRDHRNHIAVHER